MWQLRSPLLAGYTCEGDADNVTVLGLISEGSGVGVGAPVSIHAHAQNARVVEITGTTARVRPGPVGCAAFVHVIFRLNVVGGCIEQIGSEYTVCCYSQDDYHTATKTTALTLDMMMNNNISG